MSEDQVVEAEESVVMSEVVEAAEAENAEAPEAHAAESQSRETHVPLSALQKERKKRQELEQELQWRDRQAQAQAQPKPVEEDLSRYESATKEDLRNTQESVQFQTIRAVEERMWIKNNPEKYEKVNEHLQQFLKQRPNLISAVSEAQNRFEEAYTLMDALTPKQQKELRAAAPAPKKDAPNAPTGVPKSVAMNQAVDVMGMNDSEFAAWRGQQRKRR